MIPPIYYLITLAVALVAIGLYLKGTPMQAKFTLTFVIAPAPPPPIVAADLTFPGTVGVPEAGSMQLSGGTGALTVSVDDPSTLPPGVSVDPEGNVAGPPSAAGTFSVPVTVTDQGA